VIGEIFFLVKRKNEEDVQKEINDSGQNAPEGQNPGRQMKKYDQLERYFKE
jgi:hypothetical protein